MLPRRRRGFAVCAGSCLPSQILNKTHKIKGIPYVNSSFSCFCLLYKYWKTRGASAIKIDVSQKHRITNSQCDLLRRYIHKHHFFFFFFRQQIDSSQPEWTPLCLNSWHLVLSEDAAQKTSVWLSYLICVSAAWKEKISQTWRGWWTSRYQETPSPT